MYKNIDGCLVEVIKNNGGYRWHGKDYKNIEALREKFAEIYAVIEKSIAKPITGNNYLTQPQDMPDYIGITTFKK